MTLHEMQLTWPKPKNEIGLLDILGVMGWVGLLVARYIPVAVLIPNWGCLFKKLTGIPCPGCGLTRTADHFAHFHFQNAFLSNPLGGVAALFFAVLAVWVVLRVLFRVPYPSVTLSQREWNVVKVLALAALVLNYAYVIVSQRFPELLWG